MYKLFNLRSDEAKGRTVMLSSGILASVAANLSGGVFYSGFLLGHDIDIVQIGILTFIPAITTIFCMFTPLILERFKKRRIILAIGRAAYYTINILGLTLLPEIVQNKEAQLFGFGVIVFTANAINSLFTSGYTVWHLNFLPDEVRADYFNLSGLINNMFVGVVLLASSAITDAVQGSGNQLGVITLMRYAAYAVALIDVLVLALPKEYPYPKTAEKPRLLDTIRLPLKHKKFMMTMWIMFAYTFAANITAAVLNTYLLDQVHVSYTFVNGINAAYFAFFIFFGAATKRMIAKYSWFKTFAITLLVQLPTYVAYAFVTSSNYLWLMLAVRLAQHVMGVFLNTTYSNFVYINLPKADRTCYISFYTIFVNIASLLSMLFGTYFVKFMGDTTINIFGAQLGSVQILLMATGLLEGLVAYMVLKLMPKITPDPDEAEAAA